MTRSTFSCFGAILAVGLFTSGCNDPRRMPSYSDQDGADGGAGGATLGALSAQSAAGGPQLTTDHPGWKQPFCLDCHGVTAPYAHTESGYEPPRCVGCHGYNGAEHRDHAVAENPSCADCHSTVQHVPQFEAPSDCLACHQQRLP